MGSVSSVFSGLDLSITFSIISVLVGLLSIVSTKFLISRQIQSAKDEKRNQARQELFRVLENFILEDADLSEQRLGNVISAINREYDVELSHEYRKHLQDLEFRYAKRRHLSSEQVVQFADKVENLIENIDGESEETQVGSENKDVITELNTHIKENEKEKAYNLIESVIDDKEGVGQEEQTYIHRLGTISWISYPLYFVRDMLSFGNQLFDRIFDNLYGLLFITFFYALFSVSLFVEYKNTGQVGELIFSVATGLISLGMMYVIWTDYLPSDGKSRINM